MSKNNVIELTGRDTLSDPLTELLRMGAGQLIYQAVEAELQELLTRHSQRRTEDGKAGVVRNGYLPERELQTGLGPVPIRIPKVRARTVEPVKFHSALVPPYVGKTRSWKRRCRSCFLFIRRLTCSTTSRNRKAK